MSRSIDSALRTARKYALGGDIPEPEDLPPPPAGVPQITVRPPTPQPGIEDGAGFPGPTPMAEPPLQIFPRKPQEVESETVAPPSQLVPENVEPEAPAEAAPQGPIKLAGMLPALGSAAKTVAKVAKPAAKLFDHGFLDTSGFMPVPGGKLGTMPGGIRLEPGSGDKYYVKQAPSLEQAKNEKLAAELYKLAGVPTADVHITNVGGKPGIASKMIDGQQLSHAEVGDYGAAQGLHENFSIDAWLANWDAPGTGIENPLGNMIVGKDGLVHRIDTGGSLYFKGTGGLKPKGSFGDTVGELQTMKDPNYSHINAEIYGTVKDDVAAVGAQRLANVDEKEISRLVELYGPSDQLEKLNLLLTLLKRKKFIEDHYGVAPGGRTDYGNTTLPGEPPRPPKETSAPPPREDPHQPLTEEEYQKWGDEIPPPVPEDFVASRLASPPNETSRAVEAIKPLSNEAKSAIDEMVPITDTLGGGSIANIFGKKMSPSQLEGHAKKLVAGPYGPNHWAGAVNLWKIAEHVNPQVAEALFRNLPPSIQPKVGWAIKALSEELQYSPWNSVAKGSGKDGKIPSEYNFFSTKTQSFSAPPSSSKDSAFQQNLKDAAAKISPEEYGATSEFPTLGAIDQLKKPYEPIPNGWGSSFNAQKEADALLKHFKIGPGRAADDYDAVGIGNELAKFFKQSQTYPVYIYNSLPKDLKPKVSMAYGDAKEAMQNEVKKLHKVKAETGDFTSKEGKEAALSYKNNPIGIEYIRKEVLKPIKDWRNWKPEKYGLSIPKFSSEAQRIKAKLRGFNTNFEIHKGGDFTPSPVNPAYPGVIKDPAIGKDVEKAWFGSDDILESQTYGPGVTGGSYIARADKAFEFQWSELNDSKNYWSTPMHNAIEAARKEGADILVIHGVVDQAGHPHTQYAVINPAILRGPEAKFDPKNLHKSWPLAGIAGGSLFTYGQAMDEKKNGMKRGGTIDSALNTARGYARGGHIPHYGGMIKSSIPGRTDKIPLNVAPGSYILPADIPSALGEGNTMAGEKILGRMFKTGPYGSGVTGAIKGKAGRSLMPKFDWMRTPKPLNLRPGTGPHKFADGGGAEDVPIIAAGGEYVIHPEQVQQIGHGDMDAGHRVLDSFVLNTRKRHIETLKKLKPPKQ